VENLYILEKHLQIKLNIMKKHATISISIELYTKFKEYCDNNGYSISKLNSILIENKLKEILKENSNS